MASKGFETDKKVLLRRLVALPLVFFLAFLPAVPVVHATDPVTAATLAVTGGQLAGAGLAGEAGAASLAGPVGVVVGLTLAACGVSAYVTQASQEAGMSRTKFVATKLVTWAYMAGYTQEQIYEKIAQGVSVAADGTIKLGQQAAKMIQQFGNWLFTQEGEVVPSISNSTAGTCTIGNYSFGTWYDTLILTGSEPGIYTHSFQVVSGGPCFIARRSNGITYIYSFTQNTSIFRQRIDSNGTADINQTISLNASITNRSGVPLYYNTLTASGINGTVTYIPPIEEAPFDILYNYASTTGNPAFGQSQIADDVFTGTPEQWAENKDVLNPSAEDTPVVLNPDLLNPIIDSLADGQQATMSIIDYIQALQDAWDHALDDVQTAIGKITDTLTGIQESIAVPDAATKNPTVTNPSVTPETTPVLDPSEVDTGTVITGFQFDLTEIFPFCLPFDVYKMLRFLDAEPVAPSYRFQFDVPIPGLPGHSVGSWHFDYTIDLAQFNAVAALLRKLELLSFCIGLAYVTRSMFIRS